MSPLCTVILVSCVSVLLRAVDSARVLSSDCNWLEPAPDSVLCRPSSLDSSFSVLARTAEASRVGVRSVRLQCREEVGGVLTNRSLAGLSSLTSFAIDGCRIDTLPPVFSDFQQLQHLTLRTRSEEMEQLWLPDAEPLRPLSDSLRTLDLSWNSMWSVPDESLCFLQDLTRLNLSHNQLQEMGDLGFASSISENEGSFWDDKRDSSCELAVLQDVDLSYNSLTSVTTAVISKMPSLQRLFLQHNQLITVESGALRRATTLTHLDLSNNRLQELPHSLLHGCRQLQQLLLGNNSLASLPAGILSGLSQLLVLDVSGNQLSTAWLNSQTFAGLMRLLVLDLSHNSLTQLDRSLFADLYSLQVLRLDDNRIDTLAANSFAALSNLHTLTLTGNRLMRIGARAFNGLHTVSMLSLSYNSIDEVHPRAFSNISSLTDLSLSGNQLTQVPVAINNLQLLKKLDLTFNKIISFDPKPFRRLQRMEHLSLQGNLLLNISKKVLGGMPNLRVLNLADNQLANIVPNFFQSQIKLEAVRLDGNKLKNIGGLLVPLANLKWLNISDNEITVFDYAMLPRSLEWLDLHSNSIKELADHYDKADSLTNLRFLDASFNRITALNSKNLPKNAEDVLLNDNLINSVEHYTFFLLKQLMRVDLFANQITHMDLNALRLSSPNNSKVEPSFSLGGNPFVCDCTMEWLQRYNSLDKLHRYPQIVDLDSIYCRLIYNRQRGYVPLAEADTSMFLCPYKRHCFTTCHCCEFDACDCEMTCPDKCNCYHDQDWKSNIVDCSNNGFDTIPDKLPMDATEVYLDGNNIQNLSSLTFLGRKNMQSLFLNSSNIHFLQNLTFAGLPNLKSLHLENNKISEFEGKEFDGLKQLRELYVQDNAVGNIGNTTFNDLSNLEILHLRGNRINNFSIWELKKNPYLVDMTLSGNLWSCSCKYMTQFRKWLAANLRKVEDYEEISCWFDSVYEGPRLIKQNETCFVLETTTMVQRMIMSEYVPLVVVSTIVFILLVCLVVVMLVYRQEVRLCMYSRCGVRFCYGSSLDTEQGRAFDAFISYSEKDRNFVHQILAPKLEQSEPAYRLALHYRDFPPSAYLADTIVEAVESSRRTIIVLSKNFLENEWCRFQFKSAHHEVLKDCRKRLIVILLGDVPYRELDADLRLYLRSTGACVAWDDKLFWDKLRLAMPAVSPSSSVQHSASHYSEIDETRYYHTRAPTMDSLWT